MSAPLLTRIVAAAVNISQKSARILREIKKSGDMNVMEKAANDFVTKADFQSQLNIIKSLQGLFPKLQFCGEEGELKDDSFTDLVTSLSEDVLKLAPQMPESYQFIKEEDLLVWVDPLDGTKEYTQGPEVSHEVTILIGISWLGIPIAGVVNQPFYTSSTSEDSASIYERPGRVIWGIVGMGAFDSSIDGQIKLDRKFDASKKKTIVTTRSHMTELVKRDLTSIPNSEIISAGGAGHKVLCVIDGKADCYLYPRMGTKRWDTCAPEAILRALDGSLTDIFGKEYQYDNQQVFENSYGIIATLNPNPILNGVYLNHLSEELKKSVRDAAEFDASKILPKKE